MEINVDIPFNWSLIPTDVTLEDEGTKKQIPAHRMLLISCSPYFKEMFNGNFSEANTKVVKLSLPGNQLELIIGLCNSLKSVILSTVTQQTIFKYIQKAFQFHQESLLTVLLKKLQEIWNLVYLSKDVSFITPGMILDIVTSKHVQDNMGSDEILLSLIHYVKLADIDQQIKKEMFSSVSFSGVSTKTLEELSKVYPEFVVPVTTLAKFSKSILKKLCRVL